MNKRFEKIYEIAEREGWKVSHCYRSETSVDFLFSKFSPAGQDFNMEITVNDDPEEEDVDELVYDNVCNAVYKFWEGYDVSEETYICLNSQGHGVNGAPWDMKEVYEDMEACDTMVHDLWLALEGREKTTEEKPKQYVYGVLESDAWHTYDSQRLKGYYLSLEDAVDAIMEHGDFDEDDHDPENIREFLMRYRQTPNTGDVNYDISVMEVGSWDE